MSRAALLAVLGANCRTDLWQQRAAWHFDSAPDRSAICRLWRAGLDAQLQRAVAMCAPAGAQKTRLRARGEALRAFGRATHILQDFYAHSNWVELHAAPEQRQRTAPLLGNQLSEDELPEALQTGYFSMRYFSPRHSFSGCPCCAGAPCPPAGFAYCHAQLAKDHWGRGHGSESPAPGSPCYFELAARLAAESTRQSWQALQRRIATRYGGDPRLDPARIIAKLAWGGDESCLR